MGKETVQDGDVVQRLQDFKTLRVLIPYSLQVVRNAFLNLYNSEQLILFNAVVGMLLCFLELNVYKNIILFVCIL